MSTQIELLRRHTSRAPTATEGQATVPTVVVGSGKGGVGTSSISALLAIVAAASGTRVLLVDAETSLGSLGLMLGVPRGPGLSALRGGETEPRDLLVPLADTLTLLPGGGTEAGVSQVERQALFRRVATLYAGYDLVVVDGGSQLESVLAACGAGVAVVLTVSTADRISVAATYALIKVLGERFPSTPVELLINREDAFTADQVGNEIRTAARHFLERVVTLCGSVPDDQCLSAGIRAGMSIQEAAVGSPAAGAIEKVMVKIQRHVSAAISQVDGRNQLIRRS